MISIEISKTPDHDWNKRIFNSNYGTIYQTQEWGDLLNSLGRTPMFIKFLDGSGSIIGQLLVNNFSRFSKIGKLDKLLKKFSLPKSIILNWSYGPIILNENYTSEIFQTLSNFLLSKKFIVLGWTHPLYNINIDIFSKKLNLQNWSTFLIDLTKSKEELYNGIAKHSGRKNIERSIKRNVEIEEINENNLSSYVDLINRERENIGREKETYENMFNSWRKLKPLGYSGFLAKKNNTPIGGLVFSFLNGYIIEAGVARSKEDTANNLYSQDLIKWKIIEWGLENKMRYYDLAGVNPNPKSGKEKGILRFKQKWGGKQYFYWGIKN